MTDDNDDIGFDLSAWEAPPAPSVADQVLARMRTPATAVEAAPARRVPSWISGVVAAAVLAGIVVLSQHEASEPLTGSGSVSTARPSQIDLGNASSAALDGSTDVYWVRDGHRIVALQPRGTAIWQIAADDELLIDAGATVAQVKASGASLRVEVAMQASDVRVIGASAATAAVVAAVTVVLYHGQIEIEGSGQKVAAADGATIEIRPNKPPSVPSIEPPTVAGPPVDPRKAEIERLEQEIVRLEELQKQLLRTGGGPVPPPVANQPITPATVHDGKFKSDECVKCHVGAGGGALRPTSPPRLTAVHGPKGTFPLTGDHANVPCADCHKADAKGKTTFVAIDRNCSSCHTTTSSAQRPGPPSVKDCTDAAGIAAIEARADEAMNNGAWAQGLASLERILKCKPALQSKAYLAACKGKNFGKAKLYFKSPSQLPLSVAQICLAQGFDPRKP